ncbi:Kanadaptin [Chelonia mydas]|uniref:Kanadaptin n=1 Tax=Chelonia mydas TaxID=8469 RepID=M7AHP2_CHEMY|nr:Kanadaptin [Chelonia mydas]
MGPEEDQESESELTVTQLKALHKQQQAKLEKTMLGEDSDEDEQEEKEEKRNESSQSNDMSCSWGMGEDAEEDEVEENPIAIEFQEEQEAFYLKDPRKALQGFFDREGEELEYEYDDHGHNTWLCRVKLPVDDASGKQLVAEAIHSGKKKEAMIQCALEACRILDARGVLRQEAAQSQPASQDSLDEFMTEIKSGCSLDSVMRKKLHLRSFELKQEQQRLKGLIKIVKPAELPELKPQTGSLGVEMENKPKKLTLPLFGAMKGGRKFKLKTGNLGKLPLRRPVIPESLLKMKDDGPEVEEEEEDEDKEQEIKATNIRTQKAEMKMAGEEAEQEISLPASSPSKNVEPTHEIGFQSRPISSRLKTPDNEYQVDLSQEKSPASESACRTFEESPKKKTKVYGPSRLQQALSSSQYPEDDPDYCVWMPPAAVVGNLWPRNRRPGTWQTTATGSCEGHACGLSSAKCLAARNRITLMGHMRATGAHHCSKALMLATVKRQDIGLN